MTDPHDEPDLVDDLREEIAGMAREGMHHPSTKPVLVGAVAGAIAGGILPIVTWPIGLIAGAGFMLYQRVKR